MIIYYSYPPVFLKAEYEDEKLLKLAFISAAEYSESLEKTKDTGFDRKIGTALDEYFSARLSSLRINYRLQGTDFQKNVWEAVSNIPYGQTATYSEIAAKIGRPKAVRAVGNALNRNPLPLVIPCHRVVGKNGSLTGFAGGLTIKEWLLQREEGRS